MLGIRFAIVFQVDGLDFEGIKKELESICQVTEVQDDKILLSDNTWHDVKIFYMDGTLSEFLRVKLKYHCVKAKDSDYVLFPIDWSA